MPFCPRIPLITTFRGIADTNGLLGKPIATTKV